MKKYELMVIFKPLLPEETRENLQKKFEDIVNKKDIAGKITETDVWGKRHLSYEIKGYDEGYYIIYKMELAPENVEKFEETMTISQDILRFMLVKESEL